MERTQQTQYPSQKEGENPKPLNELKIYIHRQNKGIKIESRYHLKREMDNSHIYVMEKKEIRPIYPLAQDLSHIF